MVNQGEEEKKNKNDLAKTINAGIDYAAKTLPTEREVTLKRTEIKPTADQALWVAIRNRTKAISFNRYSEFIDAVFCPDKKGAAQDGCKENGPKEIGAPKLKERIDDLNMRCTIHGVDAYNLLRFATEVFLIIECGVVDIKNDSNNNKVTLHYPDLSGFTNTEPSGEESKRLGREVKLADIEEQLTQYFGVGTNQLPYLRRILVALLGLDQDPGKRLEINEKLPYCDEVLQHRFTCPSMLELIWSYWHEEGMLVQAMNAIAIRFQNRRRSADRDPLADLEIDPLRPLNNLLWGYIQNEYKRLTLQRRAYEYDHHYGISLYGTAVPNLRSADSRSKFLEAFHNLLYRASDFYTKDADTTVVADGFPLLNALKEVHLSLAEGAHNQFGDLPWTARVEMLIEQWLLARPEMRDFLRGRAMVPYREKWMGQVDAMKKLQSWTDTTITHFNELAVFGEQILLSIRYGDWIDVNDEGQATNWARYWKPEIQSYIHAYRTITGVDLTSEMTDARKAAERYVKPSVHLQRRLAEQTLRR